MKNFSKEAVWGKIIETLLRLGITYEISPIEVGETIPSQEVLVRIYFEGLAEEPDQRTKIFAEIENDLQRTFGYFDQRDEFWHYNNTKYMFIRPPKKRE